MNYDKYKIKNLVLISNWSINLTEFYINSEDLDRNSKWGLSMSTKTVNKQFLKLNSIPMKDMRKFIH